MKRGDLTRTVQAARRRPYNDNRAGPPAGGWAARGRPGDGTGGQWLAGSRAGPRAGAAALRRRGGAARGGGGARRRLGGGSSAAAAGLAAPAAGEGFAAAACGQLRAGAQGGCAEGAGWRGGAGSREIHLLVTEPRAPRPGPEPVRLRLLRGRLGARAGWASGAGAGRAVLGAPSAPLRRRSPSVPRAPSVADRAPGALSALRGAAGLADFGAK